VVSLNLTDDQVVELARRLPRQRQRELAKELLESDSPANAGCEDDDGPRLVEKDGLRVIRGKLTADITDAVDQMREDRIQEFIRGAME
jgi:hypothetical protein